MEFCFCFFVSTFFPARFVSTLLKCAHWLITHHIQIKKNLQRCFSLDELEKCTLAAAEEDNEGWVIPCCCYDFSAAQFKPALCPSSRGSSSVVVGDGDVDKWLVEMSLLVESPLTLYCLL